MKSLPASAMTLQPHQRGFSLIEAMLSVLLGCFIVLAAISVFISSQHTMAGNNALASVQESSRTSFEMVGRDLREAGGNPCSAGLDYVNLLTSRNAAWWGQFRNGIQGYGSSQATDGTAFGTAVGQRVAGTSAMDVHTALAGDRAEARLTAKMTSGTADLAVSPSGVFTTGDLLVACDPIAGYVFQATTASGTTVKHAAGGGPPGNCAASFASDQATCTGTAYIFDKGAVVAKLSSVRWYVGNNDRGGTSLYRASINNTSAATPNNITAVEIAPDVAGMDLSYLVTGAAAYVDASAVSNWRQVRSVRMTLRLSSGTRAPDRVQRTTTQYIAMRNRTL